MSKRKRRNWPWEDLERGFQAEGAACAKALRISGVSVTGGKLGVGWGGGEEAVPQKEVRKSGPGV